MPVYRAKLRIPIHTHDKPSNDGLSTCGFIFTNIGMVGDS